MAKAAPKPCTYPGCGRLAPDGTSRCESHPFVAWEHRRTADKRVRGRKLQARRKRHFERDPMCVECAAAGRQRIWTVLDHKVPLARGGADDDSNLQGLCDEHHEAKSKREAAEGRHGTASSAHQKRALD